jgi:hypothetical protein
MEKVFCVNCKHFDRFFPDEESICRKVTVKEATPIEIIDAPVKCFKVNKKNDCKHFEKYKWPEPKKRRKLFFFNVGGSHV